MYTADTVVYSRNQRGREKKTGMGATALWNSLVLSSKGETGDSGRAPQFC